MASQRKRKQGKISRGCVRATLTKATKLLCDNLRIDDHSMLLGLLSEGVVELDDVTRINKKDTDTEKVEALLGILVKASVSAYYIFMVKLEEIRQDLYYEVKQIEEDVWKEIQEKESGATSSKKARSKKTGGKKAHKTKKTTSAAAAPPEDDDSPNVTTNITGNDNVVTVCQHGNQNTQAQTSGTSNRTHSTRQESTTSDGTSNRTHSTRQESTSSSLATSDGTYVCSHAVAALKDRRGSSLPAIKKYIAANYKCDVAKLNSHIKNAIRRGVANGTLAQVKGTGASGSFRLGAKKVDAAAAKAKRAARRAASRAKKAAAKAKKAAKGKAKKAARKSAKKAKKPKKKTTKKTVKPKKRAAPKKKAAKKSKPKRKSSPKKKKAAKSKK